MPMTKKTPKTVDAYIANYPKDVQVVLEQVRATIKKAVPKAKETIKYTMPTFELNGLLLSFGAYKKHIGLYPIPAGDEKFEQKVAVYKQAKSTLAFPLDAPMPLSFIAKVAKLRAKDNAARVKAKEKQY